MFFRFPYTAFFITFGFDFGVLGEMLSDLSLQQTHIAEASVWNMQFHNIWLETEAWAFLQSGPQFGCGTVPGDIVE